MSDSEYEADDFTAGLTSVILGFPGKEATRNDLSVLGNHIGGLPIWLGDRAPASAMLECKVCAKSLDFLTQLSCPLPDKDYDRVLYVFICPSPACRRKEGSVRAIRGVESNDKVRHRIAEELDSAKPESNLAPKANLGDSLFSSPVADNPFGNPFGNQAEQPQVPASSDNKQGSKKKSRSKRDMRIVGGKYTCKLIETEGEYLDLPDLQQKLEGVKIEEMDIEPDNGSGTGQEVSGVSDSTAKELEARADPVFAHFIEIVEANPEQLLRYERGLKPLLYSGTDGVAEKLKSLDERNKVLEVQLMPHLIAELETEDMIADGMEWGSIFIAADVNDSLPDLDDNGVGYVEELVAVQWE